MKVLIIGSGGHARMAADILSAMADTEPLGFACRGGEVGGVGPLGFPILGNDEVIAGMGHDAVMVAIGDNLSRKKVFDRLVAAGENLVCAIHPTAIIAPDVRIGKGCMICPGAIVNTGSRINDNVILNTGCTIDHDCLVDSHGHVAPGVNLAGSVTVGQGAFVGIGSSVVPGVRVGSWATVGAGAAVLHDIDADCVAVGVPARVLEK